MAMASSSSSLSPMKLTLISLTLLSTLLFFLLFHPPHPHPSPSRLLLQISPPPPPSSSLRCSSILSLSSSSLLNYTSLHLCLLSQSPLPLSLPILSLILLSHFYFLVKAASDHFSPVVTRLSSLLRLSPSMAAVTLLALGNGAPDVFASVAAVRAGQPRTGLGAILSAGAFVTAFVVGSVAVLAGPFSLDPAPFVRDVFFYLLAASGMFYVYLSAEIFLWQAVGLIGFYVFFVGFVFWMDLSGGRRGEEEEVEMGLVVEEGIGTKKKSVEVADWEDRRGVGDGEDGKSGWSFFLMLLLKVHSGKIDFFFVLNVLVYIFSRF